MFDPLTMTTVAYGTKLVDNAIQYYTNKNSQKQAQANTRKNMNEQAELEDSSWYNRIARSTQALKAAGLSPALAGGQAQGAAAVTPTASPMPQVGQPSSQADFLNSMMLTDSQIKLNEAAANKAEAEAAEINQEVGHKDTRDYFINSHLHKVLEDIRDSSDNEFTREFAQSFIDENSRRGNNIKFDYGALDAFEHIFFGLERSKRQHFIEELTNYFDRKVMSMQISNGAAQALANFPKDQRRLMYKTMLQMDAAISKLASDVQLNNSQRAALSAQIEKYGQEIQTMLHNDPVAMYNSGEIGDLLVKLGFEGTTGFLHGVGFGAGMAAGQKLLPGSKGSSVSVPPASSVFNGSGFKPEKLPTKVKGEQPKGLKLHQLQSELQKMRDDGTKYFKPEVYRKKLDEYERAKYGVK